jgi:hypothetical protein
VILKICYQTYTFSKSLGIVEFCKKTFNKLKTKQKAELIILKVFRCKPVKIINRKIIPKRSHILLETGEAIEYYKSYVVKFSGRARIFHISF